MSDLEQRIHAAIELVQCSPPHRTRGLQRDIVTVVEQSVAEGPEDTDLETGTFIETLLSTADQLVTPVHCPTCRANQEASSQPRSSLPIDPLSRAKSFGSFLPSEFNRDGDFYRCPWCNTYPNYRPKKGTTAPTFYPSESCRKVELVGNLAFAEYCYLYHGEGSCSSCYVWDVDGTPTVQFGVLFTQRLPAESSEGSEVGRVWTTYHLVAANPSSRGDGGWEYEMRTTLYVDFFLRTSPDAPYSPSNRISGFVSHAGRTFRSKAVDASLPVPHVAVIGSHIQKTENRLRDLVGLIYFTKVGVAVSAFKGQAAKQKVMLEVEPVAAAPPVWEEVLDEEGNLYYYNAETGESSWDAPDAPIKPLSKKKKKKSSDAPAPAQEEVVAEVAPVAEASPEPTETVESVLEELGVSASTPQEYARALRKQLRIKTVEDLLSVESPEDTLSQVMEAYGDRRKVLKWLKKRLSVE